MATNISSINQRNLWGVQADLSAGNALEPQRNDLYMVDFTSALDGVSLVSGVDLVPMKPQYVRSCTIPELRTKSDPIRRDSVPYPMPSWDDPLDPVKIVFLLDTKSTSGSDVVTFLETWLALSRAGRGSRSEGYVKQRGWFSLDSEYAIDFRFNLNLALLRGAGAALAAQGFLTNGTDKAAYQQAQALVSSVSITGAGATGVNNFAAGVSYQQSAISQTMIWHSTYVLKNAWLAAYKMLDFNYAENGLTTVESTFYIDSFDLFGGQNFG